tara:strand:+ start:546 stop:1142 length:597 start_codon:yes stop_codon:yes gene_type:complete
VLERSKQLLYGLFVVSATLLAGCVVGTGLDSTPMALNLAGERIDPLQESPAATTVLVFVRTDCPISNRYVPQIKRLGQKFSDHAVKFYLVYPNPDVTVGQIKDHQDEYGLQYAVLRDPQHVWVDMTGVTVTPEVVIFDVKRQMVYRGRIDNRHVDFGVTRAFATQHDLERALETIVAGKKPKPATTTAVGCFILDLKS